MGLNIPDADKVSNTRRLLRVSLPRPADLSGCVRVELVVAAAFEGQVNGIAAHTPLPPGGDSLAWVYEPLGSVGCGVPTLLDAALP